MLRMEECAADHMHMMIPLWGSGFSGIQQIESIGDLAYDE